LKYGDTPFAGLEDIWDSIVPPTFQDIVRDTHNVEARRVALNCLGLERMKEQLNVRLINEESIAKTTMWVTESGELVEHKFDDTYRLYELNGEDLFRDIDNDWRSPINKGEKFYYITCKDTSTDREYLLWVDIYSVYMTKQKDTWSSWASQQREAPKVVNAIDCVAWTITTDIAEGYISHILRQGDCILVKPKGGYERLKHHRHLTADEYRTLLLAES
jgi:hypothetical protein